jgi:pilus assembly protein CpaB
MLRLAILILAVGAGGLAGWLALSRPSSAPASAVVAAPQEPTGEVLVASVDLLQGQVLNEANFRWQQWPRNAINPAFITRAAQPDALTSFKEAIVRTNLLTGEPIREEKLARGSAGLLAIILPSGKRAMAIRVNAESTAGGFILPNDRVDVIQTISAGAGGDGAISRTLLSNIRVLAVDQSASDPKDKAVVIGKTVTLELTPAQTHVIVAGQAAGTLSLALRALTDNNEKTPEQPEVGRSVRILRGGQSSVVSVQ